MVTHSDAVEELRGELFFSTRTSQSELNLSVQLPNVAEAQDVLEVQMLQASMLCSA